MSTSCNENATTTLGQFETVFNAKSSGAGFGGSTAGYRGAAGVTLSIPGVGCFTGVDAIATAMASMVHIGQVVDVDGFGRTTSYGRHAGMTGMPGFGGASGFGDTHGFGDTSGGSADLHSWLLSIPHPNVQSIFSQHLIKPIQLGELICALNEQKDLYTVPPPYRLRHVSRKLLEFFRVLDVWSTHPNFTTTVFQIAAYPHYMEAFKTLGLWIFDKYCLAVDITGEKEHYIRSVGERWTMGFGDRGVIPIPVPWNDRWIQDLADK